MTGADLVFACILQLLSGKEVRHPGCQTPYVREVAGAIRSASDEFHVPAEIIAAVARHESGFKQFTIGARGEVGLMQVMRGGAVQGDFARLPNQHLADIHLNVWLGTAYLAKFAHKCRSPNLWLTPYNGGRCVVSRYSTAVLKDLEDAKRRSISMNYDEARRRPRKSDPRHRFVQAQPLPAVSG
jgi:soluble lytic murein transglycosylase-like protein